MVAFAQASHLREVGRIGVRITLKSASAVAGTKWRENGWNETITSRSSDVSHADGNCLFQLINFHLQ